MKKVIKKCANCSQPAWTSKTVDGTKIYLCQRHSEALKSKLAKEKKAKALAKKREKKRENVTEKKLDTIFSLWIRHCYPQKCHSTLVSEKGFKMQCAHFIGRNNRCTRFDTRNCYPTLPSENMYNQLHVIELAKRLKEYYGIDYTEWVNTAKKNSCKLFPHERKDMYDVFLEGYKKVLDILERYETGQINEKVYLSLLSDTRTKVIQETKRIW